MIKRPICDLHSGIQTPDRFCDVIINGDEVYLEQKRSKNKYQRISWDDVVYQVESVREDSNQEQEATANSPVIIRETDSRRYLLKSKD